MDDLDALLQDLEATIPPPVNVGPKPTIAPVRNDVIFDMEPELNGKTDTAASMSTLQGNLSELDSLLEDLYNTEDLPTRNAQESQSPNFPTAKASVKKTPSITKSKGADIDNMLEELEESESKQNGEQLSSTKSSSDRNSPISATSAAQQLDELMASLVGFQVDQRDSTGSVGSDKSDPPYAKPDKSRSKPTSPVEKSPPIQNVIINNSPSVDTTKANDLDAMLKNMNSDLSKQGILPESKGNCGACGKPVMGEVTTALGKVWHPEHFVCAVCDEEIGRKTFFEREGKPYCDNDYHKLFSPTCAYCKQPVLGQCVTALNDTWHPEHFFCAMCSNFFGDEGFHEHEGKPYCRADFYNMFAPKCAGCLKPILANYISALNVQWHPECFVCRECLAPFTNGSFFELDGMPYCETHYHLLRGSLCSGCQKPITGRCITAMGKKFHPEHFVCAFCLKQLNKGTFKEQNEKPYCHQCFSKLFALPNVG